MLPNGWIKLSSNGPTNSVPISWPYYNLLTNSRRQSPPQFNALGEASNPDVPSIHDLNSIHSRIRKEVRDSWVDGMLDLFDQFGVESVTLLASLPDNEFTAKLDDEQDQSTKFICICMKQLQTLVCQQARRTTTEAREKPSPDMSARDSWENAFLLSESRKTDVEDLLKQPIQELSSNTNLQAQFLRLGALLFRFVVLLILLQAKYAIPWETIGSSSFKCTPKEMGIFQPYQVVNTRNTPGRFVRVLLPGIVETTAESLIQPMLVIE